MCTLNIDWPFSRSYKELTSPEWFGKMKPVVDLDLTQITGVKYNSNLFRAYKPTRPLDFEIQGPHQNLWALISKVLLLFCDLNPEISGGRAGPTHTDVKSLNSVHGIVVLLLRICSLTIREHI